MVGDALEVADRLEQLRRLLALTLAHGAAAQLDEIGADDVLIVVAALLVLTDGLRKLRGVGIERGQGVLQRPRGARRHPARERAGLLQRQRGRREQALVELRRLVGALAVRHQTHGEPFEQAARGQKHGRAEDVENRVYDGNAVHGGRLIEQGGGERRLHDAERRQQHRHADHVEQQVDDGGAARVLVRPHGREQRRDAGADVLAHDDGDGRGIADAAGDGQRLQDADGGRARLDHRRDERADEHAEQRVREREEQVRERRHVPQPRDGAAHRLHAEHQRREAQQDEPRILLARVLAEHIEDDADQRQHGRERRGLEQLHPEAAAVDARKAQKPRRDGRADVRAHDDVDGLAQRHQPGVHKADDHDGRGRRALDDRRDAETGEKAQHHAAGHLIEQRAQPPARAALKCLPHQIHAKQEQAEPSHQRQCIENSHLSSLDLPQFYSDFDNYQLTGRLSNPPA